jgi:hypothetical protein
MPSTSSLHLGNSILIKSPLRHLIKDFLCLGKKDGGYLENTPTAKAQDFEECINIKNELGLWKHMSSKEG